MLVSLLECQLNKGNNLYILFTAVLVQTPAHSSFSDGIG
jgi:hypothetical protein